MKPQMDRKSDTLENLIYEMASSIEAALIRHGAERGRDYTVLDLYKLAEPFAVAEFDNEGTDYAWQSKK